MNTLGADRMPAPSGANLCLGVPGERCTAPLRAAADEGLTWNNRVRVRRHAAVYRQFHTYGAPPLGCDGTYLGQIGIALEVTARA